ncbi:MAG: hypothetical protein EXS09_05425 [Gemmataceae bacterium]|nr:hypothetical protein [Gemmataceae bacterium]
MLRVSIIAFILGLPLGAIAKDPCVSGPQIGQRPGPYSFLVATGPQRGQPTCYVCETAGKPGIIVFARSLSDPLARVLTKCDDAVVAKDKEGLKTWLTILGEKTVAIDELSKWAKRTGLKSMPVGVFDDPVGPPGYKLAEDADVTILLFIDRKVTANLAFRSGELDEAAMKKVAEEIARHGAKK